MFLILIIHILIKGELISLTYSIKIFGLILMMPPIQSYAHIIMQSVNKLFFIIDTGKHGK